jgi:hypothetical protein
MKFNLTRRSYNRKTGPIPVSITSRASCPPRCPWYTKGCYANGGPLAIHWKKTSGNFTDFLKKVRELPDGQLWRHNQAGDLPGKGNKINSRDLDRIVKANWGKKGFTYTHKLVLGNSITAKRNRAYIFLANLTGFTINLSADSLEEADKMADLKMNGVPIAPVTVMLPSDFKGKKTKTPRGRTVIVCPASLKTITCEKCMLCAVYNRKTIIGFPAHGSGKGYVDKKIMVESS